MNTYCKCHIEHNNIINHVQKLDVFYYQYNKDTF